MSTSILKSPTYVNRVSPSLISTPFKKKLIDKMNESLTQDNLLVQNIEPHAKVAFDQSVSEQKHEAKVCASGKKAVIDPKKLSFSQFMKALSEDNGKNGLGCGGDTPYVTYEDGKYCCTDKGLDDQQLFDYINILLNGAMANVDDTMFIKNREMIEYLIKVRKHLISNNKDLIDTIVLPVKSEKSDNGEWKHTPYTEIDDWFNAASDRTDILKTSARPDDFEFDKNQKELNSKRMTPIYYYPPDAPSRRGLPEKQGFIKQIPNDDDIVPLVEKPLVTGVTPRRGLVKGTNGLKLGGKTRRRKRNKNSGSRKKRTSRNKRK